MSETASAVRADYFDGGYADMASSPAVDEIHQRHLGLPPQLLSTSLLGWDGIADADVEVRDRAAWRASGRAMWEEAAALDPGGDPALQSLHDEGVRTLVIFDLIRRVMATATTPGREPGT